MAGSRSKVTVKGQRGFDRYFARLKQLAASSVLIGIDDKPRRDGEDPLFIAMVNEFGTADGRIPARPFLRGTFDGKRSEIAVLKEKVTQAVADGRLSVDQALLAIGVGLQEMVRDTIVDFSAPPNAPRTIAQKGFDDPLIATGQLHDSIVFEIEKGASK